MYRQLLLSLLLLTCSLCEAQNLVPNGNFEQHSGCPSGLNQLYKASYWINPTGWTPDYYHKCGFGTAGVPNNAGGFQDALSDSAYAGIFLYSASPNGREFIETPLTTPLIAGNCYYFEMYLNLLDNSKYTARNIGVHFSDTLVDYGTSLQIIPLTPQLINTNTSYPDTVNWYQVSGTYVANGGESFLIIGNFANDTNTQIMNINPGGFDYAVVYIDNVMLAACTSISGDEPDHETIYIFPNPFSDNLTISSNSCMPSEIILYDVNSRKIFQKQFVNFVSLNIEHLVKGIYFYEIKNQNAILKQGRVVKK